MKWDLSRTAQQAILDTAETIGDENTIDLFRNALPQLEARLAVMQSVPSVEGATLAAKQSISSVRVYGSVKLEKMLSKMLNEHYSHEQLPDVINTVCIELETSIKEIRNWLQLAPAN